MEDQVVAEQMLLSSQLSSSLSISRDFTRSRHEEELLAQSYEQVCPWPSLGLRQVSEQGAAA